MVLKVMRMNGIFKGLSVDRKENKCKIVFWVF